MSFKKELEWHFTKDELPEIPEGHKNIDVFIVAESGSILQTGFSKYGFNTTDFSGTSWARPAKEERKTAIRTRAWAYIPEDWTKTFFPEEYEEVAEDETV